MTLNTARPRAWSPTPFSNKKAQDFLEKWLTAALRQGKYNTNLKHRVVPESKEMLSKAAGVGWLGWGVNSLAVQWVGLCTSLVGAWDQFPGGEPRYHKTQGTAKKKKGCQLGGKTQAPI